jgi:hypothetical protein
LTIRKTGLSLFCRDIRHQVDCLRVDFSLFERWLLIRGIFDKRTSMAKKTLKLRAWTKDDVRMLKSLAREKTKTTVIARKLKRTVGATYQQAHKLGVSLGSRA